MPSRISRALGAVSALAILTAVAVPAGAEPVPMVRHDVYQSVNPDGTSAYDQTFPILLRGVVLNNTEDWLDPTAAYDPGVHLWQMGGEAEFYIQAVDLPDDAWDDGDRGGTACWIGQNYGNHGWHQDPLWSYTDAQWHDELDRLSLQGGPNVTQPLRAGSLVWVYARGGLNYRGKMNVNEQHDSDFDRHDDWDGYGSPGDGENHDFDIIVIDPDFGLPDPTEIGLCHIKDAADQAIFDPTRQTGGERYQSTLVTLRGVELVDPAQWTGPDCDVTVRDQTGRTINVHLGRNPDFAGALPLDGRFDVTGIVDQNDWLNTGGYQIMAMHPDQIAWHPGDADKDASVDAGDLGILARNFGSGSADWSDGDFDGDSAVDAGDLGILARHFGDTPPDCNAVPAPAPAALLLAGAAALIRRRGPARKAAG